MLSGGQVDPAAARREFIDPSNLDPRMGDRRRLSPKPDPTCRDAGAIATKGCDGEGVGVGGRLCAPA